MCHPIGYGFEKLESKIWYMYRISSDNNWGPFFFLFSRRWREGLEGDYLWETITLNISLKVGARAITRGRRLIGGRLLLEEIDIGNQ